MKKRVILGGLALLAVGVYALMPRMVESTIPTAYYITPNQKTYENVITCTGSVQSEDVRQICLQSAAVADEVLVSVGDLVKAGDPVVRIDMERTESIAAPLSLLREYTSAAEGGRVEAVDWAALASSYGLSAIVNGGASFDAGALEELLNSSGLLDTVQAASEFVDIIDELVTAPISGVVTSVEIQPGVPVAAGTAIMTISDNQNYKVTVAVREEEVSRVRVGDTAKVRGVGFAGAVYTGVVTKVYPTARKTLSGTTTETVVDAEISLDRADKRLKPGFTARAEIQGGNDYELTTIPYEAIRQDENNNEYVYLYEDGRLRRQPVMTGQELTNEVEIIDGLTRDSVVVYNPSDTVKEGQMIHIRGRADVA